MQKYVCLVTRSFFMNTFRTLFCCFLVGLVSFLSSFSGYAKFSSPHYLKQHLSDDDGDMLSENKFYYEILPTPINHISNGEILALPFRATKQIVSARVISGTIPSGAAVYPNGLVTVTDETQIKRGQYSFVLETIDETQKSVITEIELTIKEKTSQPDRMANYKMASTQEMSLFNNGDVLARAVDPDGEIVQALQVMGTLPAGSELTAQGELIVKDRAQLVSDIYTVGIVTVDMQGNTTFFIITVPITESKKSRGR